MISRWSEIQRTCVWARLFKHHAALSCLYHSWKWCAAMGKIKFLLPKPFIHFALHLFCPVTASKHKSLIFFLSVPNLSTTFWGLALMLSPSSVFACHRTWLHTSGQNSLPESRPHFTCTVSDEICRKVERRACPVCGSTCETFPRRTLADWILACGASRMLMKSSSSSWTLHTHPDSLNTHNMK